MSYGLVAGIVKLDDGGLYLSRRTGGGALARVQRGLGAGILKAAPWLMRFLSFAGTAAMFLVGGGILAHGIAPLRHWTEQLGAGGGVLAAVAPILANGLVGVVAGGLTLGLVRAASRLPGLPATEDLEGCRQVGRARERRDREAAQSGPGVAAAERLTANAGGSHAPGVLGTRTEAVGATRGPGQGRAGDGVVQNERRLLS